MAGCRYYAYLIPVSTLAQYVEALPQKTPPASDPPPGNNPRAAPYYVKGAKLSIMIRRIEAGFKDYQVGARNSQIQAQGVGVTVHDHPLMIRCKLPRVQLSEWALLLLRSGGAHAHALRVCSTAKAPVLVRGSLQPSQLSWHPGT